MYVEKGTIEIEVLTYIRGRSISNAFIIIDECQNLSAHEIKQYYRVGENKIVLPAILNKLIMYTRCHNKWVVACC